MSNYRFINDDFKVDFEVPVGLQELIDEAEKADKENHMGTYFAMVDNIDVVAKNCYAAGLITKRQWDILAARYN